MSLKLSDKYETQWRCNNGNEKWSTVMLGVRIWGCQPRSFLLVFGVWWVELISRVGFLRSGFWSKRFKVTEGYEIQWRCSYGRGQWISCIWMGMWYWVSFDFGFRRRNLPRAVSSLLFTSTHILVALIAVVLTSTAVCLVAEIANHWAGDAYLFTHTWIEAYPTCEWDWRK